MSTPSPGSGSLSGAPEVTPPVTAPLPVRPLWTRDAQPWAVTQERMRHEQALWMAGELAMFALMWHVEDLETGLVGRCQACYVTEGALAAAYGQGNQYRCPDCYGTTFEGGYRALIIRPAIFRDLDPDQQHSARGVINQARTDIESTSDFLARTGDYCFRQDGMRFRLRVPRRVTLRTGLAPPYLSTSSVSYAHASATVEDQSSPAYMIFGSEDELRLALAQPGRLPGSVSAFDPAMAERP